MIVSGMNRSTVMACVLLGACGSGSDISPPPVPATESSRAKGSDGPGDAQWRAKLLAGTSASDAPALVSTNNPAHIDAVASFFADPQKPYAERIAALAALRTLRSQDPGEYARVFQRVKPKLWEEVAHSVGLGMSPENEKGFIEAIGWLSDQKDSSARLTMELHLDRETVRRKRLPDPALCAVALGLGAYPESGSARETLWAALLDPKEAAAVRACCLKSLKAFHPNDLEAQVLRLAPAPGDNWLESLQRRLR